MTSTAPIGMPPSASPRRASSTAPSRTRSRAMSDARDPLARQFADFIEHLRVAPAGALQDMETVVSAIDPMHRPVGSDAHERGFHEVAPAERVTRSVDAEYGHLDARKMRVAQLLR